MGSIYLRKYGAATTVNFCLYELDGTDLKVDAVCAVGDIKIMKDEGPEGNTTNNFADEGTGYSLALTGTEMEAARIAIYIVDQSNPKVWLDKVLLIETYGDASAQHAFDLDTVTVNLSAATETQIDNIEGDTNELQTDLQDGGRVDLLIDGIKGKTDNLPVDPADDSDIDDQLAAIKAETALIVADTNELQTDWVNDGRLDLLLDAAKEAVDTEVAAIKAVTDTLSLAGIADAVHDEVVDANAPAGCNSLRECVNVMVAVLAGKSSGGGTATNTFRDTGDTKNRVSATVDVDGNRSAVGTLDGT